MLIICLIKDLCHGRKKKMCFLKFKGHPLRQKIKEFPGTFSTGKFFLPFVDFASKQMQQEKPHLNAFGTL